MDLLVVLATFAVIFPAELPDKSMFAAVVMGTKFNPLAVWTGLAAAFLVHVTLAVSAGKVISFLPDKLVVGVVTAFFVVGALYMFFSSESEELDEGTSEAAQMSATASFWKIVATAFGIIFLSEWGDLTQIATVNLAARYDDPLSVGVGAIAALWLVTGLGVLFGNRITRWVPMAIVRRIAGVVLLGLAVWSAVDFVQA
jgi:Ca2+/H+ antiporter, TMEM165/GDT1 family